ncbi:MAG TPA: hypothetical protein VFR09_05410 [Alphaproteobacteria bacterium]|nr:hypothetical protein [Alphaproteobacteria bacterium]
MSGKLEIVDLPAINYVYVDAIGPYRRVMDPSVKFSNIAVHANVPCTVYIGRFFDTPYFADGPHQRATLGCQVNETPGMDLSADGLKYMTIPAQTYVRMPVDWYGPLGQLHARIFLSRYAAQHDLFVKGPLINIYNPKIDFVLTGQWLMPVSREAD